MQQIRAGATPHLKTYASMAMQLCETAAGAGIELAGTQFTLTGEPLTRARLQNLAGHGARAASDYGSNETGQAGEPCAAPDAPDDVHLMDDLHGVIQAGPAGQAYGFPSRALLVTSRRSTAPPILLNVSMGDEAWIITRSCGAPSKPPGGDATCTEFAASRSSRPVGGLSSTPTSSACSKSLLPARFGGAPAHYQLVEEEAPDGQARLSLVVDPAVGPVDLDGRRRGVPAGVRRPARVAGGRRRPGRQRAAPVHRLRQDLALASRTIGAPILAGGGEAEDTAA